VKVYDCDWMGRVTPSWVAIDLDSETDGCTWSGPMFEAQELYTNLRAYLESKNALPVVTK